MAKKAKEMFRITGRVIDHTTRQGLAGLRVEAWDKDQICNDLVGSAVTNEQGAFVIEFTSSYFKELFLDRQPDLFFKVFREDELIKSTEDSVLWNVAAGETEVVIEVDVPVRPEPNPGDTQKRFVVRGQVRFADGTPLASALVRAYDKDLRSKERLGKSEPVTTDTEGRYEITYTAEQFSRVEKRSADLLVEARQNEEAGWIAAPIRFNAQSVEIIDVTLGGVYRGPSEFSRLMDEITPLLDGLTMSQLTENSKFQDITFLSSDTGIDRHLIAWLAVSALRAEEEDLLQHEEYYGLFRKNLPTDLDALLEQETDALRGALENSARDNIVRPMAEQDLANFVSRVQQLKAGRALRPAGSNEPASLGELLAVAVDAEKHERIAKFFTEHGGATNSFWKALKEDSGLEPDDVKAVKQTLALGTFTNNHLPLVRELYQMGKDDVVFADIRGFAQLDETEWQAVLRRPQPGNENGKLIGFPPGQESIESYARTLNQFIENAFPMAVISNRLERDNSNESPFKEAKSDLLVFFSNNPEFSFTDTPPDLYLSDEASEKLRDIENPDVLRAQLKSMQRVFNVTPRYPEMRALLVDDLHSALAMVHVGERRFTEKYAEPLGGPSKALEVYRKAEHVHATALNVYMKRSVAFNSPLPYVISGDATEAPLALSLRSAKIPNLSTLFGSLDLCDCRHCQSLYSPAAYLVDILKFLNDGPWKDGMSPLDVLLSRRPDIEHIELTCENTNTQLPYVDLVNEILETGIVPRTFEIAEGPDINAVLDALDNETVPAGFPTAFANNGYSLTDKASVRLEDSRGDWEWIILDSGWAFSLKYQRPHEGFRVFAWPQTSWTSDELRANPEHTHDPAYAKLRDAVYPWTLPLNLPMEEVRAYLGHLGVQRHEVMEVFYKGTPLAALTNPDIAREYLSLSIEEAKIVYGTITGGPSPVTTNPGPWNFWGLLDTRNDIVDLTDGTAPHAQGDWDVALQRVSIFLQQSGLSYKELLELLGTYFINPAAANPATAGGRTIGIVSTDPEDSATCHLSKLEIQVLVDNTILTKKNELIAAWSRIHRFVRLWRKIGWTMRDLDKAITALQPKDINGNLDITDNFLVQLSHIQRLRANLKVPLVNMMSWWANIDTASYIDHLVEGQPEVASLYKQLFRNKMVINPVDEAFTEDANALSGKISDHLPTLVAALGISAADLSLLLRLTQSIPQQVVTTATNGSGVDRTRYHEPMFVLDLGKVTGADNQFTIKFQESDDDRTYNDIPNVNLQGGGQPVVIDQNNDDQVIRCRYQGTKRFLRVAVTTVQGASPSLPMSAQVVLGYDKVSNELSLANLSLLYRISSLAKALKLSIRDWLTVKALIEIDPFATTGATLLFAEKLKTIRSSGFSINELDYLLRHDSTPSSGVAPAEDAIAATLDEIRSELQKIAAENTVREEPDDPNGVTTDPGGELTRKKLALLNWDTALIEQVIATLNDAVTYEAPLAALPSGLVLPNDTGTYEVNLAALPAGFTFPAELRDVVTYDATNQKLKASRFLTTPERPLLRDAAVASGDANLLAAVDALFRLQDELQGTISYDQTTERLRFTGAMTEIRRTRLLRGASTNGYYLAAVDVLFNAPRMFIARYMRTFSIQDFAANLAALPASVTVPNALKSKFYFDAAAEPKKLHFIGVMTEQEHDTLLGFLFIFGLGIISDLDAGQIPQQLRQAFKDHQKELSQSASIVTQTSGSQWQINDGNIGYLIVKEGQKLRIYLLINPADPNHAPYRAAVNALFHMPDTLVPEPRDVFLSASGPGPDAAAMFDNPTAPAERFLLVLKKLLPYLRQTLSERLVAQKMAEALNLEAKTAKELVTKWVNSPTHPALKAITELVPTTPDSWAKPFAESNLNVKLTAAAFPDQFKTFTLLHKIAVLAIKLKITPGQLTWLFDYGPSVGWLNLNTLPMTATVSSAALFAGWERLVDLFRLRDQLPLGESVLSDVFSMARDATTSESDLLQRLSDHTGWSLDNLQFLVGAQGFSLTFPDAYKDERALARLLVCLKLMKRIGGSAKQLSEWGKENQTTAEELNNAHSIKNTVKAKYDDKQWLEVAKPLKDPLREKQRSALVAYLLSRPNRVTAQSWRDVNELYEYFLIDVEMSPCMTTTRIKQAISSVQLFIQRSLMNLELNVAFTPEDAKEWAQWRKWYRVWEANRKVLLYPENWIEPELRDDKSPFYKDLENELLQSDVTMATAEDAFLHYLEKLDQVARLEIVGMYRQQEPGDTARQLEPIDILHVFGRTYTIPHIYFYRRLEGGVWSAWEKVDLDIEGDHLIPVVWNRRLYLFWSIFTEKSEQPTKEQGEEDKDPNKYWEIKLAWSEYKNKSWSPKKVSKKPLRHNKYPYLTKDVPKLPPLDVPQDPQNFSFKTRILAGEQLSIECYGTTVDKVVAAPVQEPLPVQEPPHPPEKINLEFPLGWMPLPLRIGFTFGQLQLWPEQIAKITVEIRDSSGDILETPSLGADGIAKASNFVNEFIFCYLVSKKYAIHSTNVGKDELNSAWVVMVDLKDWQTSSRRDALVGEGTRSPVAAPAPEPNSMQGIGEFTLDGCNGDLAAVPVASASMTPMQLIPIPATKFEGMSMVDQDTQEAMRSNDLLAKTPGIFHLLGMHQVYESGKIYSPSFYQDDLSTYYVRQPANQLLFSTFYHPKVCNFIKSLNRFGIKGLLTLANQRVSIGDHFYTTDIVERDKAIAQDGYQSEGIACYVFNTQVSGSSPLYRFNSLQTGDHFYTLSATAEPGYQSEGIACYVFNSQVSNSTPLYRLASPKTGDHLYTTSTLERDEAMAQSGYQDEGIACYVLDFQVSGNTTPLYRLIGAQIVFNQKYKPGVLVGNPRPIENVDFEHDGAYSLYNWELFFHTPFLIAMQLSKNQRFEEAQKWFHYIFDPTAADSPESPGIERFWRVKPFYDKAIEGSMQTLQSLIADTSETSELKKQVAKWEADPFKPHVIARMRVVAYMKAVVMRYIDNLIAWGDQLFRRGTIESINEATQLYILAAQILGKRPESIPAHAIAKIQTFHTLDDKTDTGELDRLSNAMVEIESFLPPSVAPTPVAGTKGGTLLMPFFCIPGNDKLLGYWDTVADRLFKIRHCMNIEGVERSLPIFEPEIDPGLLVRAAAAGIDIASALNDINAAVPHYRFNVMVQKASELCNDVKALGGAFLSALEKRDAEALALLRSSHEIELLTAIREIKAQQINEANNTLAGLMKYEDVVTTRQQYYLSREFMNPFEIGHIALAAGSLIPMAIQLGAEETATVGHALPNAKIAAPTSVGTTYGGENIGNAAQSFGSSMGVVASMLNTAASLSATLGGYLRRQDDWTHQADLATKELQQVKKQIAAAEIRLAISEHELQNHDLQIENAKEVDEYMRAQKFTNQQLYSWMVGQLSGIYFQSYQLAYDVAKRAERTFRYELGLRDSNFIQFGYWDSLKKGLLSGERLYHDLKRMDVAYLDQNKREYEITKHISLITLDPISLIKLKETGECFISLPEALFDIDYPGHYMRRVKSVSISIPCVTGPYTSVNCTLTQHSSTIRHANTLLAGKYAREGDDTRFSDSFGTIQSIVTSSGQSDSGLFEANMRDERYLPFEGHGAISMWRIELPKQFKSFDYDTISDVVLHLRYTAREGGALLKQKAALELQTALSEFIRSEGQQGLAQVFSLRHEFSSEWYRFLNPPAGGAGDQTLTMALTKERFPFLFQDKTISITAIELFVKVKQEFSDSHNESTLKLALAAGATAPTSGTATSTDILQLMLWNGLLRTSKDFNNPPPPGAFTLNAWLNASDRLDPNAIQDILVVCRYTCL